MSWKGTDCTTEAVASRSAVPTSSAASSTPSCLSRDRASSRSRSSAANLASSAAIAATIESRELDVIVSSHRVRQPVLYTPRFAVDARLSNQAGSVPEQAWYEGLRRGQRRCPTCVGVAKSPYHRSEPLQHRQELHENEVVGEPEPLSNRARVGLGVDENDPSPLMVGACNRRCNRIWRAARPRWHRDNGSTKDRRMAPPNLHVDDCGEGNRVEAAKDSTAHIEIRGNRNSCAAAAASTSAPSTAWPARTRRSTPIASSPLPASTRAAAPPPSTSCGGAWRWGSAASSSGPSPASIPTTTTTIPCIARQPAWA